MLDYKKLATAARILSIDMVENAKSGHPGMPMGMADVVTVLFADFLRFNPNNPLWEVRDRFVLSAGHGCALLYSVLFLSGYKGWSIEDLRNFRKLSSKATGHPEKNQAYGIETTTGPLGQGLANAVGLAIAAKILAAKFGNNDLCYKVYVVVGDGCMMEGVGQEAISLAGNLELDNLIVIFDDNSVSIDGSTKFVSGDDHVARVEASGWRTVSINGHDYNDIKRGFVFANDGVGSKKPTFIRCKTSIAFGSPNKSDSHEAHGAPLGEAEVKLTRLNLEWDYPPFIIPQEIMQGWSELYKRNMDFYTSMGPLLSRIFPENYKKEQRFIIEKFSDLMIKEVCDKADFSAKEATRKSLNRALNEILILINTDIESESEFIIGGSADLGTSTGALTKNSIIINDSKNTNGVDFTGNYVAYGVREHCMVAAMNGLSLSGFVKPYGSTFLVFSDYCRPAIRLAAMMELPIILIFTHDSIGLGEDGPTHQPVEHLSALRLIPNLNVYRPADAFETAKVLKLALLSERTPSAIVLSRQNLPQFQCDKEKIKSKNVEYGAYHLFSIGLGDLQNHDLQKKDYKNKADVALYASGSEVEIAYAAAHLINKELNLSVIVISVPSLNLFWKLDDSHKAYKKRILNCGNIRIIIEAGLPGNWRSLLEYNADGELENFVGVHNYGASGSCEDLYKRFNLTQNIILELVKKKLYKIPS